MREINSLLPYEAFIEQLVLNIIKKKESYEWDPAISPYTLHVATSVYSEEEVETIVATLGEAGEEPLFPAKSGLYPCFEQVHNPSIDIPLPSRATMHSAGYDFFLPKDVTIHPGETVAIWLGIRCVMGPNTYMQLLLRSSLGVKLEQIRSGIIDADYAYNPTTSGEICLTVRNRTDETLEFKAGERIAQGIIQEYKTILVDVPRSSARTGGHGSTNQ